MRQSKVQRTWALLAVGVVGSTILALLAMGKPAESFIGCALNTDCGCSAENAGCDTLPEPGFCDNFSCVCNTGFSGTFCCPNGCSGNEVCVKGGTCQTFTPTPTITPTPTVTPTPTPTPTPLALGEACISGPQCASTFCASGVCCNAPCTEPNQACNLPNSAGFCRPLGGEVPAASHMGLVALCVLLAAIGIASLVSVRFRSRA